MRYLISSLIVILAASIGGATDAGFSLDLADLPLRPPDPRTEARLAQWNSPMGRLTYHMQQEQAMLGRAGLVGGGVPAMAVRVAFIDGLPPRVLAAVLAGGVEEYQQPIAAIRWPWHEGEEKQETLPLDSQLAILLGRRLESKSDRSDGE